MSHTERLLKGIKILRRFSLESGVPVHRHRFEGLVDSLNECASDSKPKATRCEGCPYLEECIQRFDAICNRVAMSRKKNKSIPGSQPCGRN